MDKTQALHSFWAGFGNAYDQNTVPEDAPFPRITYSVSTDSMGQSVLMNASVWDRNTSWATVEEMASNISKTIGRGGMTIPYDEGLLWIKRGSPFAQRMEDADDSIRRILINIEAEFISAD